MHSTLHYTNNAQGPILATLVPAKPIPYEETVERRHGVFKITTDDAGRWLLFEHRTLFSNKPLREGDAWEKVVTVERDRKNPMFYTITKAETNEHTLIQARFAKQVLMDILDFQEQEFLGLANGI